MVALTGETICIISPSRMDLSPSWSLTFFSPKRSMGPIATVSATLALAREVGRMLGGLIRALKDSPHDRR